jgi:hypothetical protein
MPIPEKTPTREEVGKIIEGLGGKLFNTPAAAERLGLKPQTLAKWRIMGVGPGYRKYGSRVFYHEDGLKDYERNSIRASTSDPGPDPIKDVPQAQAAPPCRGPAVRAK